MKTLIKKMLKYVKAETADASTFALALYFTLLVFPFIAIATGNIYTTNSYIFTSNLNFFTSYVVLLFLKKYV